MNPDVARAVPELERAGVLDANAAKTALRVATGSLVSVPDELRILLYAGVLLVTAGVGLLVRQNLERIGPTVVALALAVAAAGCLLWVARRASPFSRGQATSPHLAFDYLLLLGALLAAADLAYVEVKFTPLGASWTWHLLLVAVFYAALAFRYDSRTLFSLALTTLAAWRGVSLAVFAHRLGRDVEGRMALEAMGLGLLFVVAGAALGRIRFKPHFEPVAVHLGWLLFLLGPMYRLGSPHALLWALVLIAWGAALAAASYHGRRFWLFAMGVVAAHVGLTRWVYEGARFSGQLLSLWLVASSLAVVIGLAAIHRRAWGGR